MWFGIYLLFSPLITLLSWIPLVGSLIAAGASIITIIFSFVLAIFFTILTLGIAWFYYRPVLALIAIGTSMLIIGLILFIEKEKTKTS
jgi:hypothetical protein